MKKKAVLLAGTVILLVCGALIGKEMIETKPFKDLSKNDIAEVTVKLLPPDTAFTVNDEEVKELVEILNRVVTYREDDSYTEYAGQAAVFTIIRTDGTQLTVNAYNPFIIIDGIGYRTKYGPCEELNSFANRLESGKEGA